MELYCNKYILKISFNKQLLHKLNKIESSTELLNLITKSLKKLIKQN